MESEKKEGIEYTTIRISRATHKLLIEMGHKGQSYDEIIKEQITKRNNHGSQ